MRWLTAVLGIVLVTSVATSAPPVVGYFTYKECKQKITTFFEIPVSDKVPAAAPADAKDPKPSAEPTLITLGVVTWKNGGIFTDDKGRCWWLFDGVPFIHHLTMVEIKGWIMTSHTGNQYFMTETGRLFRRMH